MVSSPRETIFLNTNTLEKRYKIFKPKHQLEQLPADSTPSFAQNLHDVYANRPNDPNFETTCLAHFATHCILLGSSEKLHVQSKPKRSNLLTQPSQYIRKKAKPPVSEATSPKSIRILRDIFMGFYVCFYLGENMNKPKLCMKPTKMHMLTNKTQYKKFSTLKKKAVQHIRSLQQKAQADILCPVTQAFITSQFEADLHTAEYINTAFVMKNSEGSEVFENIAKTSFSDDEFKSFSQFLMTDEEYINKLQACKPKPKSVLSIVH